MGTAISTIEWTDRPVLSRHIRMRHDPSRDREVLLGPEVVVVLNGTGVAILRLCDGERTVQDIVAELTSQYGQVEAEDVRRFLNGLLTRRYMELRHG